jgi:hypothetical protein
MRKRTWGYILLLCLVAALLGGCDRAAGGPSPTPGVTATPIPTATPEPTPVPTDTPEPTDTPTPAPVAQLITPNPEETPISIDPLDKPTRVPLGITYVTYSSQPMGISFDRPAGWTVNTPADSNVQFIEPDLAAKDGYPTQLTVRVYQVGSKQDSDNAKQKLLEVLEDLAQLSWSNFDSSGGTASGTLGSAKGYYAYYKAEWEGNPVSGRVIVVAHGNSLYMMRISAPRAYYSDYEEIYRKMRSSWKFL